MDWMWVLIMVSRQASAVPADQWAATLTALDTVRAQAFKQVDPRLLRQVYVEGSELLTADGAAINAYRQRDAHVEGGSLRILSCKVLSTRRDDVRLEVIDVVSRAAVVWADGSTTALPDDRPSRRVITMRRTTHGWRIAGLVDAGSSPVQRRVKHRTYVRLREGESCCRQGGRGDLQ